MTNLNLVLTTLMAVVLTWTLHEFAHWGVGELLGNEMVMTLNACYPKSGLYAQPWHASLISAAGPMATLIQAIVFYFLLRGRADNSLFPFLLSCVYMRVVAGIMNFINLNDEGRISKDLGLGTFALPIIISAILFYLTYDVVKTKGYSTKFVGITLGMIMVFSSMVILTDQMMKIRIL